MLSVGSITSSRRRFIVAALDILANLVVVLYGALGPLLLGLGVKVFVEVPYPHPAATARGEVSFWSRLLVPVALLKIFLSRCC